MPNFYQTNLNELMAAIDIGSNSFHLAIARLDHGEVRKLASMSEKVQLAAGLDENHYLSQDAQQRGLDCLSRFVGRLGSVSATHLRVVATNALRQAKNADEFIKKANAILPKPIEIIAGREEARLIYLGVSHTNAFTDKRLVIDIGGGSTEFIIGKGFQPILTESLQMGCVSYSQKFFANGEISEKAFQRAIELATQEMSPLVTDIYQQEGWHDVMGSSGSIKAISQILVSLGLSDTQARITYQGLKQIKNKLIKYKHISKIDFPDFKEHRKAILPAGVAILFAIMKELKIDSLAYSDGALREGVMYDMLGRFANEDVRDRSVQALMIRYSVDKKHAKRVTKTAKLLFEQVKHRLGLNSEDGDLLRRTAYLHEIGLAISHSAYHRHSAYLLENSDIDGFSQVDKKRMACLAYHHRRKLKSDGFDEAKMLGNMNLVYLCLLLRLAVKIHHGRSRIDDLHLQLIAENEKLWVFNLLANTVNHTLLLSDLKDEIAMFQKWGIQLMINHIPSAH